MIITLPNKYKTTAFPHLRCTSIMYLQALRLTKIFAFFVTGAHVHTVLQMLKVSQYKVFDLWNLKLTHCGSAGSTNLYRHDYIDHLDPACVLSVKYDQFLMQLYCKGQAHITDKNILQILFFYKHINILKLLNFRICQ